MYAYIFIRIYIYLHISLYTHIYMYIYIYVFFGSGAPVASSCGPGRYRNTATAVVLLAWLWRFRSASLAEPKRIVAPKVRAEYRLQITGLLLKGHPQKRIPHLWNHPFVESKALRKREFENLNSKGMALGYVLHQHLLRSRWTPLGPTSRRLPFERCLQLT